MVKNIAKALFLEGCDVADASLKISFMNICVKVILEKTLFLQVLTLIPKVLSYSAYYTILLRARYPALWPVSEILVSKLKVKT